MRKKVFSIYDAVALVYAPPFVMNEEGEAVRVFADMANQADNRIGQHATDYTLFYIGTYDDSTGVVTPEDHKSLGIAASYIRGPRSLEADELFEEKAGGTD